MRDGCEVRLIGIQGGGPLTAVADILLVLIDGGNRHHQGVTIRSPNTLPWTCLTAAPAICASVPAVPCREQD
ncbi:MAG: hypothetical protein U0T81_19750 [Saprospiraceae bacterium]